MRQRHAGLSACVISYNRAPILGTCLAALGFADEVLVIDKSSTDDSRAVAARFADLVITVPWSPTVEETRAFALSQCRHEWILLLDDDECLNAAAVDWIQRELTDPQAEAYAFPLRHYILGVHDPRAYYWPEHHVRLFRHDAVRFGTTVHAGMTLLTERVVQLPADGEPCIHHLSHPDVAGWIERTNRYTSRPDRARLGDSDLDLVSYAHARIDHWMSRSSGTQADGAHPGNGHDYPAAVALLRAVYDMVDRLKDWEADQGLGGKDPFAAIRHTIHQEHRRSAPRPRRRTWLRRAAAALLAAPPGVVLSPPAFRRRPE